MLSIIITSGVISIILFQSLVIAPDINRVLSKEIASKFLRHIWPKFFIVMFVLCLINSVLMYFSLLIFSKNFHKLTKLWVNVVLFFNNTNNK